jgi:hypothetical protein
LFFNVIVLSIFVICLSSSAALRVEFTDQNLKKIVEANKVRIYFINGKFMIIGIRVLFNFLEKESRYRTSYPLRVVIP